MKNILLLFVVVMFFIEGISAATINAASCEQVDVQATIDSAVDGDIVIVPAGNCEWFSEVEITKPISIIGKGSNNTILTANGDRSIGFFYIYGFTSSELMRVSGFYFNVVNWTFKYGIVVSSTVDLSNLRIDHNIFNQGGIAQISVSGSKGVIDNNYFHNGRKAISYSGGRSVAQAASWEDLDMGSSNALFIEDNYFIDNKDVDVYYPASIMQERIGTFAGGKLVIRHNIWDATAYDHYDPAYIPLMTHGSALDYYGGPVEGQFRRGQSTVEIYNNIISAYRIIYPFILRGSANMVYNNAVTTAFAGTSFAQLNEEEFYSFPQWEPLRTAWPGEDQIHNTFIWNNIRNGYSINISHISIQAGDNKVGIQENRDFFMHEPQATGGKATFIGRNGAAGSYPTDGTLYPYTGTMIFNSSGANAYYLYTPYTYPHPLTIVDTCQSLGYQCCDVCETGTEQSAYNSDCPGQVCCGSCQGDYFQSEQYIEAEDGDLVSPIQIGTDSGASGGKYVYASTDEQGSVAFTFNIQNAGEYKIEAKVNSHMDTGRDSFYVGLDSEPAQGDSHYTYDTLQTDIFSWDDVNRRGTGGAVSEFDPMIWNLSTGLHTFTFYGRERNTWLDQIILKPVISICCPADTNTDGVVSITELMNYISQWKSGSVTITELMTGIGEWKNGC